VPVVTGPVSIALQGSVQWQGTGTASATPSLAFAVTMGKQQQVTVPITFVSALGLPGFYMGQQLATLANLDAGSADKTAAGRQVSQRKTAAVSDILYKRAALEQLFNNAVLAYGTTKTRCRADQYGNYYVGPFIPLTKTE